jgi:hypothetical protein
MKRIFALLPLMVSLAVHAGETPSLMPAGRQALQSLKRHRLISTRC